VILFSRAADSDDSKFVAQKIMILGQHDPEDRSSIVGETVPSEPHELADAARSGEPRAFAQTVANLQVLYRISEEAVRPSISIEQLLQRILDLTIEAVGADRGCMLLQNPVTEDVVPQVFSPLRQMAAAPMPVSRSIVDYVLRNRHGVRTSDARADSRFIPGQSILQGGIREAICVPMQGRYELMGVIYVDITTPPERVILEGGATSKFSEDLLRLMVAIGRQSALAIEDNRYQQALVKAERLGAVGQTIATLSHHIKNILQGVRGGSYLIDMGLNDHNEDVVRKGWKIVEKNQNKIYHLVMDMLTFSKERQPAHQLAALNDTVGEVCELMQARAAECEIAFECDFADDIPLSMFDPEGIHRAVLNIVTNAFDAVEGQGAAQVTVTTGHDPEGGTLFVAVTDNGPGIPPEIVPRLFNIFESTKGSRGTGLGLAVSQKIIREHGGEIAVDSQPGQGCQFMLIWPQLEEDRGAGDSKTLA
jgi:signal transduction histidine kinase